MYQFDKSSLQTALSRWLDVDTLFVQQLFGSSSNKAAVKFRATLSEGRPPPQTVLRTATTPPIAALQSRHVRRRYQRISALFVIPVAAVCSSGTSGSWRRRCTTRYDGPLVCLCCPPAVPRPALFESTFYCLQVSAPCALTLLLSAHITGCS